MAKVVKNTYIAELLQVSQGNLEVYRRMNEEFSRLARGRSKRPRRALPRILTLVGVAIRRLRGQHPS